MSDSKATNHIPQAEPSKLMDETTLHSIYRTSKKTIQEYVREIERHNRYKTARADLSVRVIMDNRGALIDLYDACIQQDAHLFSTIETLRSQVFGERYMMARQTSSGQYIKNIEETKKIQGTQFIKIIQGILEAKLYGYSLIEICDGVDKRTGKLKEVNLIERRNILPDQKYVVKRQGQYYPGWDLTDPAIEKDYILVNNGDLGMFSATTPLILAKKFTFANYVSFAQTYGQPIIQGMTADEGQTARNQLANEIASASAQRIIVTGLQDELKVHALSMSNSEKIYSGLIEMANAEVSNLVLGSESMAGATQSYVGSSKAHQDIFRDRVEVYREYIENVMNEEVIPRLEEKGVLEPGNEFKYANKLEMSNEDRIKLYNFITDKYNVTAEEIEKEFGITVGEQFNVIKPGEAAAASSVEARANFLSGK